MADTVFFTYMYGHELAINMLYLVTTGRESHQK